MKLLDIGAGALIIAFYFGIIFSSILRVDNVKNKHKSVTKATAISKMIITEVK